MPVQGLGFAHIAVPYGSPEEYLRSVLPALVSGLKEERRVLLAAPQGNLDLVRDALGADAGRVRLVDSEEWFRHPARTLAASHEFARSGPPALIVGEAVWKSARDAAEWARVEAITNIALAGLDATAMCVYRAPAYEALRSHPVYLGGGQLLPNPAYVPPETMAWEELPFTEPPDNAMRVTFSLPEMRRMRQFVKDVAMGAGLDPTETQSLVLACSEIAANAVEHGAGHGLLSLWVARGELITEITNRDGGLATRFPGYIPPRREAIRGYGLWISRQLCDLMEVRTADGVTRVRLHMRLTR